MLWWHQFDSISEQICLLGICLFGGFLVHWARSWPGCLGRSASHGIILLSFGNFIADKCSKSYWSQFSWLPPRIRNEALKRLINNSLNHWGNNRWHVSFRICSFELVVMSFVTSSYYNDASWKGLAEYGISHNYININNSITVTQSLLLSHSHIVPYPPAISQNYFNSLWRFLLNIFLRCYAGLLIVSDVIW